MIKGFVEPMLMLKRSVYALERAKYKITETIRIVARAVIP
jgi:hypothetical protein